MNRKRILLLNPPYPQPLSRDYTCPHTPKGDYGWPAVDLVAVSGILSDEDLVYRDAVRERQSVSAAIREITDLDPGVIFLMVSSISETEDLRFISSLRGATRARIAVLGDIATFDHERLLAIPGIDHLVRDFTNAAAIRGIARGRHEDRVVDFDRRSPFSIGIPRHELFARYDYCYPYSLHNRVAPVLTNYGCPYRCRFCNAPGLGFKTREGGEVLAELESLRRSGTKEVFFKDYTFLAKANRPLLEHLSRARPGLVFHCNARVDTVDADSLRLLKQAGCYLVFYGLETGSADTRDRLGKGFTPDRVREAMRETRALGIETLASFIIGFPHETAGDVEATVREILELDPDYLSLNVFVARHGSEMRREVPPEAHGDLDISMSPGLVTIGGRSVAEIRKSTERRFYFRPSKLLRFARLALKSPHRVRRSVRHFLAMVRRTA